MPRLFVAINLPDALKHSLLVLQDNTLPARWTSREQLHLTLRFIGKVNTPAVDHISTTLSEVNASPFTLSGLGLGVFPSPRRPRVLFAHIKPDLALLNLQQRIENALCAIGLPPDFKPYQPHITLARMKNARFADFRDFLQRYQDFELPPFVVTQFHLFESITHPGGARYDHRAVFRLNEASISPE